MINMAYSTDLPINTMGRRVRTRLYFTSESHLHTLLNVLRFAKDRTSVLSEQGVRILNGTSELCYLTQLAIRLFEDNRWEMTDPRRFRVEILFSPGATATPLHMHEQDRDSDPSRFDTAPLEMIGREGLTCRELEDFFNEAVMEGATVPKNDAEEDEEAELEAREGDGGRQNVSELIREKGSNVSVKSDIKSNDEFSLADTSIPREIPIPSPDPAESLAEEPLDNGDLGATVNEVTTASESVETDEVMGNDKAIDPEMDPESEDDVSEAEDKGKAGTKEIRNLERRHFWSTVAIGSFMLAASCLVLALNLSDSRRPRRYSTRRF